MPFGYHVDMTLRFSGPPQADEDRIFHLAQLQLMGFFYWITYQKDDKRG